LEAIALGGDEATLARVSAALIQLSQRGRPGMRAVAANLRTKQAHLRHDKAAAKIQSLGGKLSGEGELEGIGIAGFEFGFVLPQLLDAAIDIAEVRPEVAGDDAVEDEPAVEEEGPLLVGEAGAPEQARDPDPPPALPEAGGPVPIEAADAGIADPFVGQDLLNAIGEAVVGAEAGESPSETLVLDAEWRGGDKGLAVLRELPNIVSVSLSDAKLTDSALGHIATLPKLDHLSVEGKTGITAEGLTRFRKARPATQVYARGEALLGVNAEMSGPCVLSSVANGSGAFEAGLKPGDEIASVGGLKVGDFSDLTIAVFTHKAGEKLVVEYRRDGERKKVDVVLKARGAIERVQP
jgi:hypothetical protein